MKNGDFKMMMAEMCLAWVRATGSAEQLGWSEKRTVKAMLEMIEHGYAWFECQEVGTTSFETGAYGQRVKKRSTALVRPSPQCRCGALR